MPRRFSSQSGFSLTELLVAMAIMMVISGAAVAALLKMTAAQATIWNRTQMHSGIRGATEVLQQEVGQAGRIALPGTTAPTILSDITLAVGAQPVNVSNTSGMFVGQKMTVDAGGNQEIVTLTAVSSTQISGVFTKNHTNGAKLQVFGAFREGVIPPALSPSTYAPGGSSFTYTNGSTGTVLKLFGDINADGNMVYIEYTCVIPTGGVGKLYRNMMAWNATGGSPAATESQILLANVKENPGGAPCFTYQTNGVGTSYYVTDVAITLTVQTQLIDPVTKQFQTETKALLNVSPRNVFHAWQMGSLGISDRVQPIPATITALLP